MKEVLESDLKDEQAWKSKADGIVRTIDYMNRSHVIYLYNDYRMGCLTVKVFISEHAGELVRGPEPKSWAEKSENVYCELVWNSGTYVHFWYAGNVYWCNNKCPGDIIEDGYRLLGYYFNKGGGSLHIAPFPSGSKAKYAKLVKDKEATTA